MGQYYKVIILAEKSGKKEFIRFSLNPSNYNNGVKLMEHSYIDNNFVSVVEDIISSNGMFYKSRIVWAGDYADNEPDSDKNLNKMARAESFFPNVSENKYTYILNHTKKQYVNKKKFDTYHPLPLLLAEGNGRGGGDYHGSNEDKIGIWARDVISVDEEIPEGFEEYDTGYCKDSVIEI